MKSTSIKNANNEPEWNENFNFFISDPQNQQLDLKVSAVVIVAVVVVVLVVVVVISVSIVVAEFCDCFVIVCCCYNIFWDCFNGYILILTAPHHTTPHRTAPAIPPQTPNQPHHTPHHQLMHKGSSKELQLGHVVVPVNVVLLSKDLTMVKTYSLPEMSAKGSITVRFVLRVRGGYGVVRCVVLCGGNVWRDGSVWGGGSVLEGEGSCWENVVCGEEDKWCCVVEENKNIKHHA